MSDNNNKQRTSPRFADNPTLNDNQMSSPIRMDIKRSKAYSSSQDPNCVADAAAILSQSDLNNIDPKIMNYYLQKLDLVYQNLDGRVKKLEHIFADQLFGINRGAAEVSLLHNNNGNIESNNSSIYNNSTSSGQFEFNPSSISGTSVVPSNCSGSSSSTIGSIMEPIQREINKSDLDDYCLPLLQKKASPSIGELNSIVMNLKRLKYPDLDNKFILSKVREWFRRKREYMSQRIFNVCSKKFSHYLNDIEFVKELLYKARNNPDFVAEIGREANLEIVCEASAWEFCSEKISNYLENISTHANISMNSLNGNHNGHY